nr:hypothetical protein [uncultured Tolumonas sp.]
MLPVLLYEALPLIYLSSGSVILVVGQSALALTAAVLLYCAGVFIWVMRSENRRTDRRVGPSHKFIFLPETLYEFKPFIVLFIGLLLVKNEAFLIVGVLIIFWALFCVFRRIHHRRHVNRHLFKMPKMNTHSF